MTRKVLLILVLTATLHFLPFTSYGQCELKIEYKVEGSNIQIKAEKPTAQLTLELYDLLNEKVVAKREGIRILNSNDWTVAFENMEKSTYVIVVKYNGCETILGGFGINIGSNSLQR